MGIIFAINMIINIYYIWYENFYTVGEIPIGKHKGCKQFLTELSTVDD